MGPRGLPGQPSYASARSSWYVAGVAGGEASRRQGGLRGEGPPPIQPYEELSGAQPHPSASGEKGHSQAAALRRASAGPAWPGQWAARAPVSSERPIGCPAVCTGRIVSPTARQLRRWAVEKSLLNR